MNNNLMILGAGIYQVPLIRKAKELGYRTVVVSYPGRYPGFDVADEVLHLDTTDSEAILDAAKHLNIVGICTTGTDVAMSSIGLVNDTLGLAGISGQAACILTDKSIMKEKFVEAGVRTAAFEKVYSLDEAVAAFKKIGPPCVIKVTDKSGSRGIIRVDSEDEIPGAYAEAMNVTGKEYLLVEKCIIGHEIGIDAFVSGGRPVLLLPHDKLVYKGPSTTVPVGHIFPFEASPALYDDIREQVKRIILASGMDNCAMNIDAFVCGDELYVIEAGGRCGATCIPELISMYGGIDYYALMIRAACGLPTDFTLRTAVPCMASLLYVTKDCSLVSIDTEKIRSLRERDIFVSFDHPAGAHLNAMRNGTDRIGQIYAPCASASEFEKIRQEALSACIIQ
ncbi:MAG: ATP-grasp domain-containing protein [Lachnospiraceae bacterium]|nr:ATP-grasp domain-containing protein [Lachnospiraceae bacterium]